MGAMWSSNSGPGRPQQASLVLGFTYSQFAPSHSPHSNFIVRDIISLTSFIFSLAFSTLSASSIVNPVVRSSFHPDDWGIPVRIRLLSLDNTETVFFTEVGLFPYVKTYRTSLRVQHYKQCNLNHTQWVSWIKALEIKPTIWNKGHTALI